MPKAELLRGTFANGVPYLRFGAGPRTLLFFAGGPGNLVPSGAGAWGFVRGMRPFTDDYTIYLMTRRSGLAPGTTTRDMADDCAQIVRTVFGGHVDLVLGASYGGLIAQHFAADHPQLLDRLVIVMSGHVVSAAALHIDTRYAELIHQRNDRAAMALRATAAFSGVARGLMAALLWLVGPALLGPLDDTFRSDVLIEAQAEAGHDATERLGQIRVPVLVVGSSEDFAFPVETVTELARRIPGAQLKLYPGGHTAAFLDRRFAGDVRAFTSRPI